MLSRYFSIHYSCTKCHTRYLFLFLSLSRFIHQVLERNTLRIIFWDLFPGTRFDRFLFRSFHSKRKLEEDNNRYKSEIAALKQQLKNKQEKVHTILLLGYHITTNQYELIVAEKSITNPETNTLNTTKMSSPFRLRYHILQFLGQMVCRQLD